jgi:hypothetical protein
LLDAGSAIPKEVTMATPHWGPGQLWHTGDSWYWRIWSISRAGDVAFSEARTFRH